MGIQIGDWGLMIRVSGMVIEDWKLKWALRLTLWVKNNDLGFSLGIEIGDGDFVSEDWRFWIVIGIRG